MPATTTAATPAHDYHGRDISLAEKKALAERYNGVILGHSDKIIDTQAVYSDVFTHLILAARAEGLGTCWIGDFENDEVKEILEIPEDWQVVAVTPLGYPRGDAFQETDRRKPMHEITSLDRF